MKPRISKYLLPPLVPFMALFLFSVSPILVFADELQKQRPIEFGVMPHLSKGHLEDTFGEIAVMFAEKTGRRINFNAQLSLDYFRKDLDSGRYDVVFLQPFDYVEANQKHGYRVVATQDTQLYGVLAVRPGSEIKKISDLKGKTISLPPEHTAISFLIKDWLMETGFIQSGDVTLRYDSSHISCLQKALFGFAAVCGTARPVINFLEEKFGFEFRVVAETRRIPHTLFAVHPRVDEALTRQLEEVILGLSEFPQGKEILKQARLKPFRLANDREYDRVRKMAK